MDSSKIPPKIALVDVSAKNDNNTNAAIVISGKLQLSGMSGNFDPHNMDLKLCVEGKEKETVQRVFASGIQKSFHVLFYGRNSLSKSHEHIFLEREYDIQENFADREGMRDFFFSVSLGNESLSWKPPTPKRKVQHRQGHMRRQGEFEVSYMVRAYLTIKLSEKSFSSNVHYWSNTVILQFPPTVDFKMAQKQHKLRVDLGAPVTIPQTKFCGLLEGPSTQLLTLVSSQNKIQLTPNQQLTIQLAYEKEDMQDGGILLDLQKVHVKFTQRTVCNGESFDRHWERKLAPSRKINDESQTLQGTVEVPGFWAPSYEGSIIQVLNEMIIYITQYGKQSKDMIATTPKIIVQVRR